VNPFVSYIYNALFCHSDKTQEVLEVMKEMAKECGVNTKASIE
jgi:hypothetical protein